MKRLWITTILGVLGCAAMTTAPRAAESEAAERGAKALLGRSFNPPFWSKQAYDNLWQQWGDGRKERPADYAQALVERYGLHAAPYDNGGLPMGMREVTYLLRKSISNDCMLCHGGSIAGQSYVGLGNASLDMQTLYEELNLADGRAKDTPFTFCNVRGTNEAGSMSVYLIGFRDGELNFRRPRLELGLRDDLCEDVPAWWLLKKKKTMYYTGSTSSRSVRSLMQFMMHPLNGPEVFKREESTFNDILAYLNSIEPPKYPFPIDTELAQKGEKLFAQNCARCHGTYGPQWTYPNKIIPLAEIGTDRTRLDGISVKFGKYYNQTWFAKEKGAEKIDDSMIELPAGYQAPPLDGVWASAPYFHNGSAPTVYHVLNSKDRPKYFTRSYGTSKEDYDPVRLGWKINVLKHGADSKLPDRERRKVYDTTKPGRGNSGHPFGDKLRDDERSAVIEYLKTL